LGPLHQLTAGLKREGEQNAAVSPDGSRVVVDRTYDCASSLGLCFALLPVIGDETAFVVVDADSRHPVRTIPAPGMIDYSIDWTAE
jgi:hypothetical protein